MFFKLLLAKEEGLKVEEKGKESRRKVKIIINKGQKPCQCEKLTKQEEKMWWKEKTYMQHIYINCHNDHYNDYHVDDIL